MKKLIVLLLFAALATASCVKNSELEVKVVTEEQKTLYALGLILGQNVAPFNLTPEELTIVQKGFSDQVVGRDALVDIEKYRRSVQELAKKRGQETAQREKATSEAFLEAAAKEPHAVKTGSGLIYTELRPGTGRSPSPTDVVKVQYRGTLTDGTEFDSSYERGPAEFPLNRVIKCWTEGVGMMKVGGKAKLVCPSEIAYGDRGRPPVIPGGATLVFEVELVGIQGDEPAPAEAQEKEESASSSAPAEK